MWADDGGGEGWWSKGTQISIDDCGAADNITTDRLDEARAVWSHCAVNYSEVVGQPPEANVPITEGVGWNTRSFAFEVYDDRRNEGDDERERDDDDAGTKRNMAPREVTVGARAADEETGDSKSDNWGIVTSLKF